MEDAGRFVEIASIHNGNGDIELNADVLEELFDSPQTKNAQIAIISVLGPPRCGKSKLLGEMLQHLQDENDVSEDSDDLDGNLITFGDDELLNKASIVTWSKPYFVTKGSKQKVAIFLMDIKGNFTNCNDSNYVTLSGLCTFMSSTILYLSNEKFEDSKMKHIEEIALEGLRHNGVKQSSVHQKIRVIIENWTKPNEYNYGDMDGDTFVANFKEKSANTAAFSAFEEFKFFFVPLETDDKYPLYFNRLLSMTLGDIYVVPKKFGTSIKAPVMITELQKYVDAMDPEENSAGSLSDFLNISKTPEQTKNMLAEKQPGGESEAARPRELKSSRLTKTKEDDGSVESGSWRRTRKEKPKKVKSPSALTGLVEVYNVNELPATSAKEIKEAVNENKLDDETRLAEFIQPPMEYPVINAYKNITDEKFNLAAFLRSQNPQEELPNNKEIEMEKLQPRLTPQQILENNSQAEMFEVPEIVIHKLELKTPDIIPNDIALEDRCTIKEVVEFPPNSKSSPTIMEDTAIRAAPPVTRNATKISRLINKPGIKEREITNATSSVALKEKEAPHTPKNAAPAEVLVKPKPSPATKPPNAMNSNSKNGDHLRNHIQLHVVSIFKKVSVQSKASAEDILRSVKSASSRPLRNFDEELEKERKTITDAIVAILLYVTSMENAFKESFNYSRTDFSKLHDAHAKTAVSSIDKSYLKASVEMKINEAKQAFQTINENHSLKYEAFVQRVTIEIKAIYVNKMSQYDSMSEDLIQKRHEEVKDNILKTANRSSLINKSSWSNKWLGFLDKVLQSQYVEGKKARTKVISSKEKTNSALESSIFYYRDEMNRTLHSGTVNHMHQFTSLHQTKYSDALRQYQVSTAKELRDIVTERENILKLQLEHHAKVLHADFLKRLELSKKQDNPPQKVHSKQQEGIKPYFQQNIPNPGLTETSLPNRCIGIHLNFGKIVAYVLSKHKVITLCEKKDPTIGYNGKIFLQEGFTLLDTISENRFTNLVTTRSLVDLKYIFQHPIGTSIAVNWNGSKSFRAEELISFFLSQIKKECEKELGGHLNVCSIIVPSYFHEIEVQAVRDAAVIAGFAEIQIQREICSAVIGDWFFAHSNDMAPKEFILVNTSGEKWDAGYYNLNQSFSPNIVSGDYYANTGFWRKGIQDQPRLKNILSDIMKHIQDTRNINVLIVADDDGTYDDLTNKGEYFSKTKLNFYQVSRSSIKKGSAFTAAYIGKDAYALNLWNTVHPVSSLQKRFDLEESLTKPWNSPVNCQKSAHVPKGRNLPQSQLQEIMRKLSIYLNPEIRYEEAQSHLITVSKVIEDPTFNSMMRLQIREQIERCHSVIENQGSFQDVQQILTIITQMYEHGSGRIQH